MAAKGKNKLKIEPKCAKCNHDACIPISILVNELANPQKKKLKIKMQHYRTTYLGDLDQFCIMGRAPVKVYWAWPILVTSPKLHWKYTQ